jgi:hypothetical protein
MEENDCWERAVPVRFCENAFQFLQFAIITFENWNAVKID